MQTIRSGYLRSERAELEPRTQALKRWKNNYQKNDVKFFSLSVSRLQAAEDLFQSSWRVSGRHTESNWLSNARELQRSTTPAVRVIQRMILEYARSTAPRKNTSALAITAAQSSPIQVKSTQSVRPCSVKENTELNKSIPHIQSDGFIKSII